MDVPGRLVSSEMHSSVDSHPFPYPSQANHSRTSAENDAFKGSSLRVIGVSPDSVEEQNTFVKNQKLTVSSPNI